MEEAPGSALCDGIMALEWATLEVALCDALPRLEADGEEAPAGEECDEATITVDVATEDLPETADPLADAPCDGDMAPEAMLEVALWEALMPLGKELVEAPTAPLWEDEIALTVTVDVATWDELVEPETEDEEAPTAVLCIETVLPNVDVAVWVPLELSLIHISEPTRPY